MEGEPWLSEALQEYWIIRLRINNVLQSKRYENFLQAWNRPLTHVFKHRGAHAVLTKLIKESTKFKEIDYNFKWQNWSFHGKKSVFLKRKLWLKAIRTTKRRYRECLNWVRSRGAVSTSGRKAAAAHGPLAVTPRPQHHEAPLKCHPGDRGDVFIYPAVQPHLQFSYENLKFLKCFPKKSKSKLLKQKFPSPQNTSGKNKHKTK